VSFFEDVLAVAVELSPKFEKVKAIDVKPHRWALWCDQGEGSKPFANEISCRKWSDDGKRIIFMLDSFNFFNRDPEEVLELIPIPNPPYVNDEEDEKRMKDRPPRER
jgi:hypothetical protein